MERQALKDEIIFTLTGGLLNCELDEKALDMLINSGLREIQRYVDSTKLITIPYSRCIDMSEYKVNSVLEYIVLWDSPQTQQPVAQPTRIRVVIQLKQVLHLRQTLCKHLSGSCCQVLEI